MDLDPSVVWDFAGTLVGTLRERPRQLPATVSRVDPDGTVWLSMPGADGLVPASTTADVQADDSVTVEWWGNAYHVTGNGTSPSVGTRAAAALRRATAAAAKVAGEAKGIADAVGQHFWADDNGVHVSNEDGNATGERNVLMNSLGILLRQGSAWLASFSDSAVAFYDGLGNEAANIVAQFGADGSRIGRIGMNRIELSEDGLVQFTDAGVIGIMAGLSATNHTVNVVTNPGTVAFDDVYYYKTSQHDDTYARKTVSAEYPFRSGYPETGVEKLLFRVRRYSVVSGRSSLSTSYEVAVPFGTSYSWQMPNTSYYLKWIVGSQGKGLQLIKETADPYGASHTKMRVYCTGYTTTGQLRSPVLMFGEHSTTSAPGLYAVALGRESTSEGDNALTAGIATAAASEAQTAIGKYNDNDPDNAFEVGNGTADDARSNAFTVDWNGNTTTAGLYAATCKASTVTLDTTKVSADSPNDVWSNGVCCTVSLSFKKNTSWAPSGTAVIIGTVPDGYRPRALVYITLYANAGSGGSGGLIGYIGSNGIIYVLNRSTLTFSANQAYRFTATYAV